MQQKSLSNWLKAAIICLAVFGLLVYAVVLILVMLATNNPTLANFFAGLRGKKPAAHKGGAH